EIPQPRVAEVGAFGKVGGEMDLVAVSTGKVAEQLHAHVLERAEVEIMASAVTGRHDVADQPAHRAGESVRCAIEESGLHSPPDDVPPAHPPRSPRTPSACDEDLASRFVQLFGQLAPRLPAAHNEHRARRNPVWVRVILREDLEHAVWNLVRVRGQMGTLVSAGGDDDSPGVNLATRGREHEVL